MTQPRGASVGGLVPRLAVVGGAMLWGTTGTTQALAPATATSASIGSARLLLGALSLAALAVVLPGPRSVRGWFAPGLRAATLAAMAGIAAYQVCFFAGVARTGVAIGTVVGIGSAPVFTGVLGLVLRGERPERGWGPATALAIAGAALLVGAGGDARVDPLGVTLALGAGLTYAVYTVSSKALLDAGRAPAETMAVTFGGGALLLAPVLVAGDLAWLAQPRGMVVALWLGVGTVGLGYLLFARGLRALPAATVATLTLAEPLTAASLGVAVLAERPGWLAALGAALVGAGLVLIAVLPRRSRAAAPAP